MEEDQNDDPISLDPQLSSNLADNPGTTPIGFIIAGLVLLLVGAFLGAYFMFLFIVQP